MLNIAIALAFVVAVFFSPGQNLLILIIGKPLLQTLSNGQSGALSAIFGYWLPALIIYLVLKSFSITTGIKPTKGEKTALTIGNIILILYLVVRIFASTIKGGGAGLVVARLSSVTALPALIIVGIVLIWIVVRTFIKERQGSTAIQIDRRRIASFGFIGSIPVLLALGYIFIGDNSLFNISQKTDQRLSELCKTAGEKIHSVPNDVQSLYFEQNGGGFYSDIKGGIYQGRGSGVIGEKFISGGLLRFFEKPAGMFLKNRYKDAIYARYYSSKEVEPVDDLQSKYGVYRRSITDKKDEKLGVFGSETVINEIASGITIAEYRYFFSKMDRRICGHVVDNKIEDKGFIIRALNLEKRFKPLGK
jgi:hypothetical protein